MESRVPAPFPHLMDLRDKDLKALAGCASRVCQLLGAKGGRPEQNPHLVATLDELLGAVYALIFAREQGFTDRTTISIETDAIRRRALAVSQGQIRPTGPWMAGFHFNSGILRLAAVYHRALKVVLGRPKSREMVDTLRDKVALKYPTWSRQNLDKIHDQVNSIKHSAKGQFFRRKVKYSHALAATRELLQLMEMWSIGKAR